MDATETAGTINSWHAGTWAEQVGLVMVSASREEVTARVVIQAHHRQPQGIVHGGVYASIVESVASIGAALDAMTKGKTIVGLDNHTSFVHAAREGTLHATGTPVTRGSRTQLWDVVLRDDAQKVVASGRVRLLVLDPDASVAGGSLVARNTPP